MAFEGYNKKPAVTIVFDGHGKGKTSASLGLLGRALGSGHKVAFIQFIKHWTVGEHRFIEKIQPLYKDKLYFYKGGKGFYNAGDVSAPGVSEAEHKQEAQKTHQITLKLIKSGDYNLVICDEINNAFQDGLLKKEQIEDLLDKKHSKTSLCLTGRGFPEDLIKLVDIATENEKNKTSF